MNIERMVTDQCLVAPFKKDVGKTYKMFVGGRVDRSLWEYFQSKNVQKPEHTKKYRKGCPGHYGHHQIQYKKLEWTWAHG